MKEEERERERDYSFDESFDGAMRGEETVKPERRRDDDMVPLPSV